jgi:hypothetical protein
VHRQSKPGPRVEHRAARASKRILRPGAWRAFLCLALACLLSAQTPAYKGKEEKLPVEVAPQPVSFSHKKHSAAGMKCHNCHPGAARQEQAGLPAATLCLGCHATIKAESPEIKRLAALDAAGEKLKWVRVYKIPDFVFFSHANHLRAGAKCATCHGPVEERDVLAKEVSTGMIACMNCHAAHKASTECVLCHQLSF